MTNKRIIKTVAAEARSRPRQKLETLLLHSDVNIFNKQQDVEFVHPRTRLSSASVPSPPLYETPSASPYVFSPWNQPISPLVNSPWIHQDATDTYSWQQPGLIGSIVREQGHIYSLAASGNLLYTGSDSKNIHVWKNLEEFSGFKSRSGLVKSIIVLGNKVFTGHQDGKIRVWKVPVNDERVHKRIGNLPTSKDFLTSSMNPKNYVKVRRHRNVPWIRHFDAVSCMSLDEENGILYSGSWDKAVKVWRLSDHKCMESIDAHDDAVNSVAVGFCGLVFTGSADGTVKMWRREVVGKVMKHVLVQTLLKQENAVTSVAVAAGSGVVYIGGSDGFVSYWVRQKNSLFYGGALRGHKMAVLCLAVAESFVASGSADKNICVWRRGENGDHICLTVLEGHTGPVKCLTIAKEGDYGYEYDDQRWRLYSGSLDCSVKVWRL